MSSQWLPHMERACCVCGSTERELRFEIRDPARLTGFVAGQVQSISDSERIVRCKRCGLVYVNPQIVWPPSSRTYPLDYFLTYFRYTRASRALGNAHLLALIERILGRRGAWLDVGSGDGLLMRQATAAGWLAEGVEIDADLMAALASECAGLRVHVAPLQELGLSPASFDVISLINVLEHVGEPKEIVAECARLLRPGGLLATHVPNVGSPGARLHGARWRHYEPATHLNYFSLCSLTLLLKQCGLVIEKRFSLPGSNPVKRVALVLTDWLGLRWHDGLGVIARKPTR